MINSDTATYNTTILSPQVQDQDIESSEPQDEVSAVFTATVSEQLQAGYKRFRTEEDSNGEGHLSKKTRKEGGLENSSVKDLVINVYLPQIALNIHVPSYLLVQEENTEIDQWSLAVKSLLVSRKITEFNNDLIKNGKEIEFVTFLREDVISKEDKSKILSLIIKDHKFWEDLEDNEYKKEYFLKLFTIEDAFQRGALTHSLKIFIKRLSTSALDWFMSSLEDFEQVQEGFRFNCHHILSALFLNKKLASEYQVIFQIYPKVDLFELAKLILTRRTYFNEPYEGHIFMCLIEHARLERNDEFFHKFAMKAFQAFPFMCQTPAVIDTLLVLSLKDLQNQIRLKAVPLDLLTYMHTMECDQITQKFGIDRDKLLDRLHFVNMPCKEPSDFNLSFYQQLLRYQQGRFGSEPNLNEHCLSISVIIALKESQIKMTRAFESVFYTLDAHWNRTWFQLPQELKQQIALEVFQSERPLSSVPKKMLLEKRMEWIQSIPRRLQLI